MSRPSQNYLDKVEKWLMGGLTLDRMAMTLDQKFRAKLVYEAYQVWLQDKQIRPTDLMRRLAAREYPILLQKAGEGDETALEVVRLLNIREGVPRSFTEISNDVSVFNWIVGRFDTGIEHIEKAKVVDASDWLIREGMKMGDVRAVKSGADIKMQLNNNFNEKEDAASKMPTTEINITGDVSIIKSDRVNYTPEERKRLAKRFNLSEKEFTDMIQNEDGTWEMPAEDTEKEFTPDVFDPTQEQRPL